MVTANASDLVGPNTPADPLMVYTDGSPPWAFERLEDGEVRITPNPGAPITIPAGQWASVMASVSWAGETAERYAKAHRFHAGDEPAEPGQEASDAG